MKRYLLLISLLVSPIFTYADDVQIVSAALVHQSQGEYFVTVTLRHDDTGWDHYADEWRIVDANGNTLGRRVLMHPHVNEQPFARGLNNVKIDPALNTIYIEAHDKLHGWSPQKLEIDLTRMQNGKLIVKTSKTIQPVIQQEVSGCGISCAAALANLSYPQAKKIANQHGIYTDNEQLWSDPKVLTTLLSKLNISTASAQSPFTSWSELPNCVLLVLKWHQINETAYWHWAIFIREHDNEYYVLDSKTSLKQHHRTDFGRMKPKWFIEVHR